MSKAQTIKSIVKGTADKPTFGTNPRDPWSAKANISEDAALNTYLKSRGINPEFATKDQKVSHSKTGQFIKWKRDHMIESITEAIDKMDVIMFDIPLLIRMLEYAREDAKTDMDLHKVVEKLIHIRKKGVLTMKDYTFVTRLREGLELDENHIAIAMGQMMDDEGSMVLNQLDQMERAVNMVRNYIGTDYEKQLPAWVQSKLTLATDYIDTVGNYLNSKNEDVNEAASASIRMYKALQQAKEKREREERLGNELLNKKPPEQKPVQKEEVKDEYARKVDKYLKKKYAPEQKPVQKEEVEIDEGWKRALGATAIAGTMALASGAHARVSGDHVDNPEINRLTGQPKVTQQISPGATKPAATNPGFKKEYLQSVADGTHPRPLISKERAQELLQQHKDSDKGTQKNENYQDPMAATSMPNGGANSPDDVMPKDKGKKLIQMSKSARIIKSIYKRKGMKEEIYDHEKEDKSVATYGKKPKIQRTTDNSNMEKPQAAAIMTGGTTLTGEKRDTIEIDPMMKMRSRPDSGKR